MIEADILMGTVTGQGSATVAIMAHPPMVESDLSFAAFLEQVVRHNRAHAEGRRVGVKLDFKTEAAVAPCLAALAGYTESDLPAIWLNADIWRGPGGGAPKFDATRFLDGCSAVCDSARWVLSVGWTTGTAQLGPYTDVHIDEAVTSLRRVEQSKECAVTFPVSAYHAYLGRQNMRRLLEANPTYTLTVWGEVPSSDCQRWLDEMKATGRVFIDTKEPGPIANQLGVVSPERSWWIFHGVGAALVLVSCLFARRVMRKRW